MLPGRRRAASLALSITMSAGCGEDPAKRAPPAEPPQTEAAAAPSPPSTGTTPTPTQPDGAPAAAPPATDADVPASAFDRDAASIEYATGDLPPPDPPGPPGAAYFGIAGQGLLHLSPEGVFSVVPGVDVSRPVGADIVRGDDGELYILSFPEVFRLDAAVAHSVATVEPADDAGSRHSLAVDEHGLPWVVSLLGIDHREGDRWVREMADALDHDTSLHDVATGPGGIVWATTSRKLWVREQGRWKHAGLATGRFEFARFAASKHSGPIVFSPYGDLAAAGPGLRLTKLSVPTNTAQDVVPTAVVVRSDRGLLAWGSESGFRLATGPDVRRFPRESGVVAAASEPATAVDDRGRIWLAREQEKFVRVLSLDDGDHRLTPTEHPSFAHEVLAIFVAGSGPTLVPGAKVSAETPTADPAAHEPVAPAPAEPDPSSGPLERSMAQLRSAVIYAPDPDQRALRKTGAATRKAEGTNVTKFCVTPMGKTEDVKTAEAFGGEEDTDVDEICRDAVEKWRFKPVRVNGKARKVCTKATFKITFR